MRRRIAFIDYFPTHYRRRLYEEIAARSDADFYFYADARERYWNRKLTLADEGRFRRVELPRYRPFNQAVMPGVARRLNPRRYDAVIKSLNGKLMLPLVYGTAKATGLPFVLWTGMWHHPETRVHQYTRRMTDGVYRGADAIVAYGEHVRQFVLRTEGVDPSKVFVAGQAVEPERFIDAANNEQRPPHVIFVGQFEHRKGIDDLLAAFATIGRPDARLLLIGNGSQDERVRRNAAADPRIEVLGFVPQEELPGRLASARCLVLPSVTTPADKEPWGLVVNEAMHAAVPVVVTDGVGAAAGGLVVDGRNGFVVPERDPAMLAAALTKLIDDAERASRMGAHASEDVSAFTHERMARAFLDAVEHAIERKSSNSAGGR